MIRRLAIQWIWLAPPEFKDGNEVGWRLGPPDLISSQVKGGFTVPPLAPGQKAGSDVFRNFVLADDFKEDAYLTAAEIIPGLTKPTSKAHPFPAVHHVHIFIDTTGVDAKEKEATYQKQIQDDKAAGKPYREGAGFETRSVPYTLVGSWFPGAPALKFKEGNAFKIPKGAKVVVQMHYTQYDDVPQLDETKIGMHFAHAPIKREVLTIGVEKVNGTGVNGDPKLNEAALAVKSVPKGAVNFPMNLTLNVGDELAKAKRAKACEGDDLLLEGLVPHGHQLQTDFGLSLSEDAKVATSDKCLIKGKWDFAHQTSFMMKEPMKISCKDFLKNRCTYNNPDSTSNPLYAEGAGVRDVDFGPDADKEMCRANYFVSVPTATEKSQLKISQPNITASRVKLSGSSIPKGANIEVNGRFLPGVVVSDDGKSIEWPGNIRELLKDSSGPLKIAIVSGTGYRSQTISVKGP